MIFTPESMFGRKMWDKPNDTFPQTGVGLLWSSRLVRSSKFSWTVGTGTVVGQEDLCSGKQLSWNQRLLKGSVPHPFLKAKLELVLIEMCLAWQREKRYNLVQTGFSRICDAQTFQVKIPSCGPHSRSWVVIALDEFTIVFIKYKSQATMQT